MSKRYIGKEKDMRQESINNYEIFDNYIVQSGDTLYDIARRNNIDVTMLSEINGLMSYDYLYPNQNVLVPKEGVKLYITKDEDTLDLVASNNNITKQELIQNNSNIYLLPGQLLVYKE